MTAPRHRAPGHAARASRALLARPRHRAAPPRSRWQRPGQAAVLLVTTAGALAVTAPPTATGPDGKPGRTPLTAAVPERTSTPGPAPPDAPTGELIPVPGAGPAPDGDGPVRAYRVEVEQGLAVDAAGFAAEVEQTLSHPAGWAPVKGVTLQRTDAPATAFTVTLASPGTTDRLCAPLTTDGRFSCFNGERAVLNADRWRNGAPTYGTDIASYRQYLVNHEVGHALGNRHTRCPAPGAPAPVMVQQSISLDGCAPNPWPTATGG